MTFYIRRNKNEVYHGADIEGKHLWSKITDTTKALQVLAFTTRKDAATHLNYLVELDRKQFEPAVISNNLDFE